MLGTLARAAYMLFIVTMIVAWAASSSKNTPPQPEPDRPVTYWYS
jgi:hypothetical protein